MKTNSDKNLEQNLKIMETVEETLNKQRYELALCLTAMISISSFWLLLIALWDKLGRPLKNETMTIGVEIIAILMLVFVTTYTSFSIKKFGVNKNNLKKTLVKAVLISICIIGLMVIFKLITKDPNEELFDFSLFDPFYPFTSVLQEFLARGFMLTCLSEIYTSKYGKHMAIICSSLFFVTLHFYYGFDFMVGAGVLSIFLGYIYMKDKNIWGISLIHFAFGMTGILLGLV